MESIAIKQLRIKRSHVRVVPGALSKSKKNKNLQARVWMLPNEGFGWGADRVQVFGYGVIANALSEACS